MIKGVDARLLLNKLRRTYKNNLIIAHLNINSIRNKFDLLKELVSIKIDILMISETKLDSSFLSNQLHVDAICHLSVLTEIGMEETYFYTVKVFLPVL